MSKKACTPSPSRALNDVPKKESKKSTVENFKISSEWKPKEENRWVIMSKIIPWEKFEEEYAKQFSENKGAPAKPFTAVLNQSYHRNKSPNQVQARFLWFAYMT